MQLIQKTHKSAKLKVFIFILVSFGVILAYTHMLSTNANSFLVLINTLWLLIFTIAAVFMVVGILTAIGLKNEAGKILDLFMEGSISFIDLIKLIKDLINEFVLTFKTVLGRMIPYFSYILGFIIYLAILIFFKSIGINHDVTFATISISAILTLTFGILNNQMGNLKQQTVKWYTEPMKKFKSNFVDSFEIVIFAIFLTIDSTSLFFIPQQYNVNIFAKVGDYNLMTRSFVLSDHFKLTLILIALGILIELIRIVRRLLLTVKNNYHILIGENYSKYFNDHSEALKDAIRKTSSIFREDILTFAAFTTFMMIVFLFFPRLKLVALITASLCGFILDLLFKQNLIVTKRDDLISRLVNKLLKLNR